jgi:hypothetical protein
MAFDQKQGYARYHKCANYMYSEMKNNLDDAATTAIRAHLAVRFITPAAIGAALAIWAAKVGPRCDWDHKPKIRKLLGLTSDDSHFPIIGDTTHEWFLDVWSNIHYGYVGTFAGFDEFTLIGGANVPVLAGKNDAFDDATMKIGIRMWHSYGRGITLHDVALELVKRKQWLLTVQEQLSYTQINGKFKHIIPMSQGNSR